MNGFAATEKIRASEGLEQVPIIAVTAHQETDFRAGAKAAGFDAYVTKPIDIAWLSEANQRSSCLTPAYTKHYLPQGLYGRPTHN